MSAEEQPTPASSPGSSPASDPAVTPSSGRPTPGPPRPTPGPPPSAPGGAAPTPEPASAWGRVAEDGTVYVRTPEGERSVGQYPEGSPEEALKFFTDRYDALAFEVHLLEQRIAAGKLSPDEAAGSVTMLREQITDAHAVGDLAALTARLDATAPLLAIQREHRRAEKAQRATESRAAKERIVEEAEKIGEGSDWRGGANRLRALLDEWKALPRLDRGTDDALWRRFSSARTGYTRRRKHHFAAEHERRDAARVVKERLCVEAEKIAGSTDWGPTAGRYRDLMREWKAAGPAPREVDDRLWARFRGAQDQFFGARDAANAALDEEFAANAKVKEELLVEAEAIDPAADLDAAKQRFRGIAARWDEAGKVPRARIKELEGRMRKVEQSIRAVEDDQWRRSDPEKSARANDMVGQLEAGLSDAQGKLDAARAAGDDRAVKQLEDDVASKQAFLDMARKASADFR